MNTFGVFNPLESYNAAVEAANSKQQLTPLATPAEIYEQHVLREYRICYSDELPDEEIRKRVSAALEDIRILHPDFDALGTVMALASFIVRPWWPDITIEQYLDIMYAVARHAVCTRDARNAALAEHARELSFQLGPVQ